MSNDLMKKMTYLCAMIILASKNLCFAANIKKWALILSLQIKAVRLKL